MAVIGHSRLNEFVEFDGLASHVNLRPNLAFTFQKGREKQY